MTALLVHGSGSSARSVAALRLHLSERIPCAVARLPGHGGLPAGSGPHTVETAADRVSLFRAQAGLDQVVLLGHSMGGSIATALALRHPEWLRALVVIDPAYGAGPDERGGSVDDDLDRPLPLGAAHARIRGAFSPSADPALVSAAAIDLAASAPAVRRGWDRSMYSDPGAWAEHEATLSQLRGRRVPTLGIYPSARRARTERAALATAPTGSAVLIASVTSHFLHEEEPAWCASRILDWLDHLPEGPNP